MVKTLLRLLCLIVFVSPLSLGAAKLRALWVDTWHPALFNATEVTELVAAARAGNFNAVIVEVRRRGDAFYNSNFEPKNPSVAAGFDPLADLITKAHDTSAGAYIAVHTWIVTYPVSSFAGFANIATNHVLRLHPEWRNRTSTGSFTDGHNYYFDPGHPGVQAHTFNVAMDIISRYDIDGFNWDYIRYPSASWGYNDVTVARFNSKFNRTGQPATSDVAWTQFRRDQVSALVRKVYLSAIAIKPHVILSADTFTASPAITTTAQWPTSTAYKSVLQDWRAWMEEGILDLNMPMTYFSQASSAQAYANWSTFIKDHRYNRHAVVGPNTGINTISNAIVQIRSTRTQTANGSYGDGVACYDYAVNNASSQPLSVFLNALTQPSSYDPILPPVFAQPDVPPVMPWKTAPTKGHIKGFVYEELGNGCDGASITISGPETRTVSTDATAFFGSVDLTPGNYTLTASWPAYASQSKTVTVSAGSVTHCDFSLVPTGLAIVLQPQDTTAISGSNAVLSVSVAGVKPISCQWFLNGGAIAGQTGTALLFTNVEPSHSGNYTVVVSNSTGSLTSLVANLKVHFMLQTFTNGNGALVRNPNLESYAPNSSVTLTANPAAGFVFSNWSGNLSGAVNPITITLTNSLSITGNFVVSPADLVLDNGEATFTGSWVLADTAAGRYGNDYRYSSTTTNPIPSTATYRPSITVPGNYDVFVWYSEGGNRATNAPFVVSWYGGSITSYVNQATSGGAWVQIARKKYFETGTNGFVQLSNDVGYTGKVVIADAVRFLWSNDQSGFIPLHFGERRWLDSNSFLLPVFGTSDDTFLVEHTETFSSWLPLRSVWINRPINEVIDFSPSESMRFYRARQVNAFLLSDLETAQAGTQVIFREPGLSGTTSASIDPTVPNFCVVSQSFPAGVPGLKTLHAKWSFVQPTNGTRIGLRLTTLNTPNLPNPTVGFSQAIAFDVYADRSIYLAASVRETSTTAALGANGGSSGSVEWIGGTTDNTISPPKGRYVPAGQWMHVDLFLPLEPVRGINGNGILESTTGKGVFESLAIVPADGLGPYNLYLDNFQFIDFLP